LPNKIKDEAVSYFKTSYSKNKEKVSVKDLKLILSEIPSSLKFNIASEIYNGSINEIHIFSNCTKNFISNIAPLLQPLYLPKNFNVYMCDEVPQKIYFILEGSVKFLTEDDITFSFLNKGTYFGEIEILRKTYRENTVKATTNLFLLTLSKSIIWDDIVSNYTEFFQMLLENMIKRHNFMQKMRDLIDFLIEEGKKSASVNEIGYKIRNKLNRTTESSNYNKYLFCQGLKNNNNNGMNKSNILKLSHMFNNDLIEAFSNDFMKNSDEEKQPEKNQNGINNLDKIYNRIERRKITEQVVNKNNVINLIPTELEEIQKKEEREDMFNENFKKMKKLHSVVERKKSVFGFKNKNNNNNNNKKDYEEQLNHISNQNEEILDKLKKLLIKVSSEDAMKKTNLLKMNSISNLDNFDIDFDIPPEPRKSFFNIPQIKINNSPKKSLSLKQSQSLNSNQLMNEFKLLNTSKN
jgi:CRP-like cAMP-binding protein